MALVTTGFSFMAYEILFLREMLVTLGGTVYASSATLAAVMSGLFIGSQIFGWFSARVRNAASLLAGMEFALALFSPLFLPLLRLIGHIDAWSARYLLSFLVVLIPSILTGGEVPVAMQFAEQFIEKGRTGLYAGFVYGSDTLGALLGAMVLPFFLLPGLGAYGSSLVSGVLDAAGGVILLVWAGGRGTTMAATGALVVFFGALAPLARAIDQGTSLWACRYRYKFAAPPFLNWHVLEESPYQRIEAIGVDFFPGREAPQESKILLLNGVGMSSTNMRRNYPDLVFFPLMAHPRPRTILLLGCGDGDLAASALRDPNVERLDAVEIDRQVVDISRRYLPEGASIMGRSVWDDPRVRLIIADARRFIEETRKTYDVIIADLPHAGDDGSSVFYSEEFFRAMRRRLNDGGIFFTHVYWLARPHIEPRQSLAAMLIAGRTLSEVFGPRLVYLSHLLWPGRRLPGDSQSGGPCLMAWKGPLRIDPELVLRRFQKSPRLDWLTPQRYMRFLENAYIPERQVELPVSTDDRPAILYPDKWSDSPAVKAIEDQAGRY